MSQQSLAFMSAHASSMWILLALVLFGIEAIMPGVYALWFAVAALVVGVATFALTVDLPFWLQMVSFVGLAVAAVVLTKVLDRGSEQARDGRDLNDRGQQVVGRTVVVDDAIANGRGRVRVGDTTWQVTGPDCPRGASVKVIASDGLVLRVEPV
jgi:inner membrane protein